MRSVPYWLVTICAIAVGGSFTDQANAIQVGVWQFNGNLNNSQPGKAPMSIVGGWSPNYINETIGGSSATALEFPALSASQALNMPNQAAPNGGGGTPTTNNWSIVMDVKFPAVGDYTSLWETSTIGTTDGDYFVRAFDGIGTTGQYAGTYNPGDWNRIAVTVDSSINPGVYTVTGYINGVPTGLVATTSTSPGGKEAVRDVLHLFADNDFETSAGFVNSVAFYGEVLNDTAVGALGGASAAGIPQAANQAGLWDFSNNLNNSLAGGAPMSVVGGWAPAYVSESIGGSPATVLSFPAMDETQALDMPNEAAPDDFGIATTTNIWTIVMDVKFPVLTGFTALWETDAIGTTDADYFVRDDSGDGSFGSVGTSGEYGGFFQANTWNRLAVTVDGSVTGEGYTVTGYIDGSFAGQATTSTAPNGKEAVKEFLHLFTDDDGETAAGVVNSIAFYDELLSEAAIAALGGATADGIPLAIVPAAPGDYNEDHVVDAADYTIWRDHLGSTTPLPNDGGLGTPIGQQHYNLWKTNFGMTSPPGAGGLATAAVPEPAALLLAIATWLSCLVLVLRRQSAR